MASRKSKKVYVKYSRSGKKGKRSIESRAKSLHRRYICASNASKKSVKRSVSRKGSKKRGNPGSRPGKKSKYTKSGKLRLKSSRKGKRASERSKRAARGCSRQTTKKYSSRKSPPYPANNCCGSVKRGNDEKTYKSIRTKTGHCAWKRVYQN